MSKPKNKSNRTEPRDVLFSANYETQDGTSIAVNSQAATLTRREAALVDGVLRGLLPLLDKEATV